MRGSHANTTTNNFLIPCFFLFDCLLLACVVVLWYFIQWWDQTFTLHLAAIPCSDLDHYAYPEEDELVPDIIVYVLSFIVPAIVVLFGETAVALYYLQGGDKQLTREKTVMTFGIKLHALIRRTVRFTGIFLLGAFITWILTRAGQIIIGRPAPNFFAASSCNTATSCTGVYTIVECPGANDHFSRVSFPSLYSSITTYASVFVAVYVTAILKLNAALTLRPFVALACLSIPYLLGVQQVGSYKAHWTDVIAGWIIGGTIAAYLIFGILDTFRGPLPRQCEEHSLAELDTHEDYVMGNGSAMRNGVDKPLQMNGLRHHGDREHDIRETYLDRTMEMNSASTTAAATGASSSNHSQASVHIPRPQARRGAYTYLYDGRRGRPVFKPLRTPPSPPPLIPRNRNPPVDISTVHRTANSEYF